MEPWQPERVSRLSHNAFRGLYDQKIGLAARRPSCNFWKVVFLHHNSRGNMRGGLVELPEVVTDRYAKGERTPERHDQHLRSRGYHVPHIGYGFTEEALPRPVWRIVEIAAHEYGAKCEQDHGKRGSSGPEIHPFRPVCNCKRHDRGVKTEQRHMGRIAPIIAGDVSIVTCGDSEIDDQQKNIVAEPDRRTDYRQPSRLAGFAGQLEKTEDTRRRNTPHEGMEQRLPGNEGSDGSEGLVQNTETPVVEGPEDLFRVGQVAHHIPTPPRDDDNRRCQHPRKLQQR